MQKSECVPGPACSNEMQKSECVQVRYAAAEGEAGEYGCAAEDDRIFLNYESKEIKGMKVVLVNGSRRENGCTYTALSLISGVLDQYGIETQIISIGKRAMSPEMDDAVREVGEAMQDADGIVVGSPVYYASPSGEIVAFLDRLFGSYGKVLCHKPGAAIASARRGGTTATLDVLNKYFLYNQMPLVSSRYWNIVHGNTPEDVMKDEEGVQIMQVLGRNMAWLLQSIEAGKAAGVPQPEEFKSIFTNFIR